MPVPERGDPSPFAYERGPIGCLLLHGFPGSPAEARLLGAYLAERDISVAGPLLPGHGTAPEELRGVSWRDWVAAAEAALQRLREHSPTCFVAGLSLGGAIALYLAGRTSIAGAIALSPAIRIRDWRFQLARLTRHSNLWVEPGTENDDLADQQARSLTWHYPRYPAASVSEVLSLVQATRRSLKKIHVPVLMVQSSRDGALIPEGACWAYERIPVQDKELVWLERSGHNILVDTEREVVFDHVYRFIDRLAVSPLGGAGLPECPPGQRNPKRSRCPRSAG